MMSKEVEDRLLGKLNNKTRICSTLHHGMHDRPHNSVSSLKESPRFKAKAPGKLVIKVISYIEPIIKPRPMSAEKILKADVSLSPIVVSMHE
jgi:hypothetical protein